MAETFAFDVFLSHSSKDKDVVRDLAERLRADGVKVWFDEWEIQPGDSIPAKMNEGLTQSRVLFLFLSRNATGSDWVQMEHGSFLFRDPLNRERRFFPIRLDHTETPASMTQYLCVDWQDPADSAYGWLLKTCIAEPGLPPSGSVILQELIATGHENIVRAVAISRSNTFLISGSIDHSLRMWDVESGQCLKTMEAHAQSVWCIAISPDEKFALSGSTAHIRKWDLATGESVQILDGHASAVRTVAISHDGKFAVSGSVDNTLRKWDLATGECSHVLTGHLNVVHTVAISPNGMFAVSGSSDNTLRVWDLATGRCLDVLVGHTNFVYSVAISQDGKFAISGSVDNTIRRWDLEAGTCINVLEGHTQNVWSVAISQNGKFAISGSSDKTIRKWDLETGRCLEILEGHSKGVQSVAISSYGDFVVSGSADNTIRKWDLVTRKCVYVLGRNTAESSSVAIYDGGRLALSGSDKTIRKWDLETGKCIQTLDGHQGIVYTITISHDNTLAISGSDDNTLRVWDLANGKCLMILKGHQQTVRTIAISQNAKFALSGSDDKTIRKWDLKTGNCVQVLEGNLSGVWALSISHDGKFAFSGSNDRSVRKWDLTNGRCLQVRREHSSSVRFVLVSRDDTYYLTASGDNALRKWDLDTGRCLQILEGHTDTILSVALSQDGKYAMSGSRDNTFRLWDMATGQCLQVVVGQADIISAVAFSQDLQFALSTSREGVIRMWAITDSSGPKPAHYLYKNAKVLFVGDSGVGKSGLARRLRFNEFQETSSTDGVWATHWELPAESIDGTKQEIWLWDFAGQIDYRLVHQLFIRDAQAAVFVFNPQHQNPFEGLGQWDRDLEKAAPQGYKKFLVAGRVDCGGLTHSQSQYDDFIAKRGFNEHLYRTSAATGAEIPELKDALLKSIDWQSIPTTSSPTIFERLKSHVLNLRDQGKLLVTIAALKQHLDYLEEIATPDELRTVVDSLCRPGHIMRLSGDVILLQPEVLSRYTAAVVRTVRSHPQELGCISESKLLSGELDYQDFVRVNRTDEKVLLLALNELFVEKAWCLRQPIEGDVILSFPSYFKREREDNPSHPSMFVTFEFDGHVDEVYATLVVLLHHTTAFETESLWKNAADFRTLVNQKLGICVTRELNGRARIEVHFDPEIADETRALFLRYVENHLKANASNVVRIRHYACRNAKCHQYGRRIHLEIIDEAHKRNAKTVSCWNCRSRILLNDIIEQKLQSEDINKKAVDEQELAKLSIDNESRELQAVHHAGLVISNAGQIMRLYANSDHGIDAEIEFKKVNGRASGKKLYLQLKSGDSYLRLRKHDNTEVFQITNPNWVSYWQEQAYPVLLVIRTSDKEMRWMDVSEYLRHEAARGNDSPTQIEFRGEPFTELSILKLRAKYLRLPG